MLVITDAGDSMVPPPEHGGGYDLARHFRQPRNRRVPAKPWIRPRPVLVLHVPMDSPEPMVVHHRHDAIRHSRRISSMMRSKKACPANERSSDPIHGPGLRSYDPFVKLCTSTPSHCPAPLPAAPLRPRSHTINSLLATQFAAPPCPFSETAPSLFLCAKVGLDNGIHLAWAH
jgi:hypothetical protein